jgi:glycosyltransferase involved in cell wall biosynthesis
VTSRSPHPARSTGDRPQPLVSVVIPTLQEADAIDPCLAAVAAQTYPAIAEVLVVDGGSTDRTRELARCHPGVQVLDNPGRIQSAGLNVALDAAKGDIVVRVDGHCLIEPDYVERCVEALVTTGAALVGGGMTPRARGPVQEAIAAAMSSPVGAGPARFHTSVQAGWVDTVYLGAFRAADARAVGGYAEDVGVNEDAEMAIRLAPLGGVWFDPAIRSLYTPRGDLVGLARQFYRYGRSRAATVRKHPTSVAARQLAAPALVLGLATRWRRPVLGSYAALVVGWGLSGHRRRPVLAGLVLPLMHVPWGLGFLVGLVLGPSRAIRARR